MNVNRLNNNHEIIQINGEIIFISYESIIATIKNGVLTLGRDWDYSRTTLKFLYKFLDLYYISKEIDNALQKANRKEAIQKLIDTNIIKYDKNM